MNLKQELIDLVVRCVFESENREFFRKPLVGFSSAEDPLYLKLKEIIGPEHIYPHDIIPGAKTIVSFFIPFSEKVVISNYKQQPTSIEWAESYIIANALINEISNKMIEYLENKGIEAETIKATHTYDEKNLESSWSHRSAAYIAGIGKFGINRMLITKVGCAGRYGTVIISHEIQPDAKSEEEFCIYYKNAGCLHCIKSCPVNALDIKGFDKFKCHDHLLENAKQFTDIGLCDVCGKCVVAGPCAIINR